MATVDIFKTPIFHFDFPSLDDIRKEMIEYALQKEKEKNGVVISNQGGFQSESMREDFIPFKKLCERVLPNCVEEVKTTYGYNITSFTPQNCWLNINRKKDYNVHHCHNNCDFSAVWYLKVPENSGRLVFDNPDYSSGLWMLESEYNPYSRGRGYIVPKENLLVIFKSHLVHFVEPNLSDDPRITLAFNFRVNT